MYVFFFFKQKTAYEMRISDWSADVCSSDLDTRAIDVELVEAAVLLAPAPRLEQRQHLGGEGLVELDQVEVVPAQARAGEKPLHCSDRSDPHPRRIATGRRPADEPAGGLQPQF